MDDKTVIVVEIFPGKMRPYYIKSKGLVNGTYVRLAGTSRPVDDYTLKELILEGQNRYYDCGEKRQVKDVTQNVLLSWGVLAEKGGTIWSA